MALPDLSRSSSTAIEHDPRPVVRRPAAGLPGGVMATIAAMLALLLFLFLNGRRQHTASQQPDSGPTAFPSPPPLAIPPEQQSPSPAAMNTMITPQPATSALQPIAHRSEVSSPQPVIISAKMAPSEPVAAPTNAPALVLDTATNDGGLVPSNVSSGAAGNSTTAGEDAPFRTTIIRNRTTLMPTGTIIPAVLETPIDSTRPGLARAVVSSDACGFDGRQTLIPKGSRLIGEYQSDVRSGQSRVLVTWTRLIRPDGVAIRISSPAADALGGAGIPGHVNSFFFQRFAGAVLQSALTVGVNLASRPGNGSVIVGLPISSGGAIGQDLVPGSDLKPRIKVRQGAALDVFVAHDLDFSGAPYRGQDKAR